MPYYDYPIYTPLTCAAYHNSFDEFKRLIEKKGADINEFCRAGASIHLALHHTDGKIAQYIVENEKFDANLQHPERKETPLMFAIIFGDQKIARLLIARKDIDLNIKDAKGLTAADYLKKASLGVDWLFGSSIKSKF